MTIRTPTDRPKSVLMRNCCVTEVFCGVFVLSRSFFEFFFGWKGFVIGLSQISCFFILMTQTAGIPKKESQQSMWRMNFQYIGANWVSIMLPRCTYEKVPSKCACQLYIICFHRTLQRARLANRGRLLLRTPGPVPFGTCICSKVETILSWACHVYGPFEFRTSLSTSILLQNGK